LLLPYADELLALASEHGLGHFRSTGLIQQGWCVAKLGRADEGIPLIEAGMAGLDELGFMVRRPWILTLLGDACSMAHRWQAALEHLAEARRLADEREDRWFQAETLRLTGDVRLALGDGAGAEASYRDAIVLSKHQRAKLWELRAATSLAHLWRDHGEGAQARDLLTSVFDWFTEGFGTPVLKEAKTLLQGA
jgi:predicted ATPase